MAEQKCPTCGGKGWIKPRYEIWKAWCPTCKGTGKQPEQQSKEAS